MKLHDDFHTTVALLYDVEIEMRRQVKALEKYMCASPSIIPPSPMRTSSEHATQLKSDKTSWRHRVASTHVLKLVSSKALYLFPC